MDSTLVFLDCTLRDGGYYNSWDFSEKLVSEYLVAIGESGVDVVELGLRSRKPGGFKGMFAFCPEEYLVALPIPKHLRVGVMVNAAELLESDGVESTLGELFPVHAAQSRVDLVRVACHLHEVPKVLSGVSWLKNKGYQVGINLMQIAGQPRKGIVDLARMIAETPVDVLYFADSLGSMSPDTVAETIKCLREGWNGPIGIHTHDNMGVALQNTLRAIGEGATWLDSTVTGMGRGPGNAKTEELAIEIAERRSDSRTLVPIFHLASNRFLPLQRKYGWGTNPYYYLAGKYGIHPTYIQEMLNDSRYDEADVLAVIENLRRVGGRKFSANTLDAARSFYQGEGKGEWNPAKSFAERDVLILGSGPGVREHSSALETFIRRHRPVVVALNTQSAVSEGLIDYRVACHPVRLMADARKHSESKQPVIMPYSMLPSDVRTSYDPERILDFGLSVEFGRFTFGETSCVLPSPLVAAYALAVASSGGASRVLMAGFDGYGADDPRSEEMQAIFVNYEKSSGACPILAITPTRYKMPLTSIYLL
jgi:4-hydroxy 2-oxovalerate aldolase